MYCFNHQNNQATCICNVCSKGLCTECIHSVEIEARPTCSNTCKNYLQQALSLNTYVFKLYGVTENVGPQKAGVRLGTLDMVIGIAFAVMGLYFLMELKLTGMSLFFIVCGFVFIARGSNFIKKI